MRKRKIDFDKFSDKCEYKITCDCQYCSVGAHCIQDDSQENDCIEAECPKIMASKGK